MGSLADSRRDNGTTSVAVRRAWRRAFIAVFVIECAVKLLAASHLPLFGDEAFYWLESRHPAWGYSDLPGMTAWLVAAGTAAGGHAVLAVRSVFLLLGAALPWLVVGLARRHFGARAGWQAGLLALGMPLAGSLGVLAVPDVPLTFACMLAVLALDAALDHDRIRHWLLLGVAVALAMATHYRAGMLLLAGLMFALATPRGRQLWRRPGWYAALALGALGALPLLGYNLGHGWAGLAFQAVERNPWQFHADALVQPLEQALVCTPLLYLLLLVALGACLRRVRQGAPWDLIGLVGATFVLGYFLFGLFADDLRFRVHWPLPGYLPLLAVVPLMAGAVWRAGRHRRACRGALCATWIMLGLGQAATLGYLGALCLPPDQASWLRRHDLANIFDGWRSASRIADERLARPDGGADVLVADNFRLAAELAFGTDLRWPVYTLDSPLNRKHGRARQMHDWQRDEQALFAREGGRTVLLAVEETALRESERRGWIGGLCRRFTDIHPLQRLDISNNKRIAFYRARLRPSPGSEPSWRDDCLIWRRAYAAYVAGLGER